ncbi:MAG: hypothetical protein RL033_3829, partial [Pseudomonadota bacterium]
KVSTKGADDVTSQTFGFVPSLRYFFSGDTSRFFLSPALGIGVLSTNNGTTDASWTVGTLSLGLGYVSFFGNFSSAYTVAAGYGIGSANAEDSTTRQEADLGIVSFTFNYTLSGWL